MSEAVEKAGELGAKLKELRLQELDVRQERIKIREEWQTLYKSLKGATLKDAVEAYWGAQGD